MPKKVSQLDLETRANLTNTYQVLVADPTNYQLYRVPVTQFRGASVFTSTNAPVFAPEDPSINNYIDGDIFIQSTDNGKLLSEWNNISGTWFPAQKLNGSRVLTASDFPQEVNLDLREVDFSHATIFVGDYYLNKNHNILFGPYSAISGFRFSFNTFEGYIGQRQPQVHRYAGQDALGYDNPLLYLYTLLANAGASAAEKYVQRRLIQGDRVHITLETDEGHGGWVYDYNANLTVAPNDFDAAYNAKLGTDGVITNAKQHWREAKTWNEPVAPVQNDNKYRAGDNVFIPSQGVIYYDYQEGIATTADLGVLFLGQTTLAGSSLKTSVDGADVPRDPIADDSIYLNGDYILATTQGTPRIHGPYLFGAGSDLLAWPLFTVLRPPVTHKEANANPLTNTFLGDYPVHTDGTMIVSGDTWTKVYTAGIKEVEFTGGAVVDIAGKVITWGTNTRNLHTTQIHSAGIPTQPTADDAVYYEGDFILDTMGVIYGPYVEAAVDDATAWAVYSANRSPTTHIVPAATLGYVPDTAHNSTEWGGIIVKDNDTLKVIYTGSTTNKIDLYSAVVDELLDTVTWVDKRSIYGNRTFNLTTAVQPITDDLNYNTGDIGITASGKRYEYLEGQGTDETSWAFLGWIRGNTTHYVAQAAGWSPTISGMQVTEIPNLELQTGDVIINMITGSNTDKQVGWKVLVDLVTLTLTPSYNTKEVRFFSTVAIGRPPRNDADYAEGDYMDANTVGMRFGPYVEGAATDLLAWADFMSLQPSAILVDSTAAENYEMKVDNGIFWLESI
jgi:hypothetical protein